jgi:hypothetical protein
MLEYYNIIITYRRNALEKWKQYKGARATYRNLIAAFEKARHSDYAETVKQVAGKQLLAISLC